MMIRTPAAHCFVFTLLALCWSIAIPLSADPPDPFAECEALVRAAPDSLESYLCFETTAQRLGMIDEAVNRLEVILSLDPQNHRARYRLALLLRRIPGNQERTIELLRQAVDGLVAEGEILAALNSLYGIAESLTRQGRHEEADTLLRRVEPVAKESGDDHLMARAYFYQGEILYLRQNLGQAWRLYKKAEATAGPDGPLMLRILAHGRLAKVAWALDQQQEAMDAYRRQLQLCRELGNQRFEATALGNMALIGMNMIGFGQIDREEVLRLVNEALDTCLAAGYRIGESRCHVFLGRLTSGDEALNHHQQALDIAREINHEIKIIEALRGLALHLVRSNPGNPEEALELLEESLQRSHDLGSEPNMVTSLTYRAGAHWIAGHRQEAIADGLEAIGIIETMFDRPQEEQFRTSFLSAWGGRYYALAGNVLEPAGSPTSPEDLELSFATMERLRARVLLESLETARAPAAELEETPALKHYREVLGEISSTQRLLLNPALRGLARQEKLDELERLEQLETALRVETAGDIAGQSMPARLSFPTLDELYGALAEDEAILYFQVNVAEPIWLSEGGAWLHVHTREGTTVHPLPSLPRLRSAVRLFLGLFNRRDGSEAEGAVQLYNDLLQDALIDLPSPVKRLIIVPDGILHRLPFGALRQEKGATPLAMRYQISLAPSAAIWLRWRQHPPGNFAIPALALVDPELPMHDLNQGFGVAEDRAWSLTAGERLGRLPRAREEAQSIVRYLGGQSRILVGAEATEQFIKQSNLQQYSVLHFAAHAVLDDVYGTGSAVILAPGSDEEDGLLQGREVASLDLDGQVVVLAACRSASGVLLRGEGVMGLARAFFQAGAHTVVGSLWPLRDDEAAELFEAFYRHLGRQKSVGEALGEAVRESIESGAPPAVWAGLVVLGNGDIVPLPEGRQGFHLHWWQLIFPLLLVAGAVLLLSFLRQRRINLV
jgi:CHAT domain-containing protein/tetratricopeptide (TPR) repeat protein